MCVVRSSGGLIFLLGRKKAGNRSTSIRRIVKALRVGVGTGGIITEAGVDIFVVLSSDIFQSLLHSVVGGLAEKRRRGAKQIDVVFALEPRLADTVLLSVMQVTHRDTERGVGFESGPRIGGAAHMAELARGAAAARHDTAMASNPFFMDWPVPLRAALDTGPGAFTPGRRPSYHNNQAARICCRSCR